MDEQPINPSDLPGESGAQSTHRDFKPPPKQRSNKKLLAAAIVIAVVLLLIGGYLLTKKSPAKTEATTKQASSNNLTNVSPTPSASDTKNYKSSVKDLDLSFDYPSNWKVAVNTDAKDSSIKYISVETPPSDISNDKSENKTGKVLILIRPRGADIAELSGDSNSVAKDSQQLAYAKPSTNQHQYPYLTFIHFGGNRTSKNPFEEVMITGNTNFSSSAIIGNGNIAGVDPLVSAAFYECGSAECAGKGSGVLSITDSVWQNSDTLKKVKAVFESLVIN